MKALLVIALVLLAVAAVDAESKLLRKRNRANCPGTCQADSLPCAGSYKSGLCAGASNIRCCLPTTTPPPPTQPVGVSEQAVSNIADASQCRRYNFAGRGQAPAGFLRGLAITFAKAVCDPNRADVVTVGSATLGAATTDALNWYGATLTAKLGARTAGLTTVRQLYTLLVGLGMRESSGVYCTGRDMSASFSSADTAEAGLFQTSWGAHTKSPLMTSLYNTYLSSTNGCASSYFKGGVPTCSASNLKNWGTTTQDGYRWQALTKNCPAFAAEYAAVLLRYNGGSKGEWGPLRTKAAEVVPACHDMFKAVQAYVAANPSVCPLLL